MVKKQLSKMEIDQFRDLSRVRIHIERVIGVLRQKYTILQGTLPIRLVMAHTCTSSEKGAYSLIDTSMCAVHCVIAVNL